MYKDVTPKASYRYLPLSPTYTFQNVHTITSWFFPLVMERELDAEQIKMMRDEGCKGCVLAKKKTFFCGLDPVSSRSCVNTSMRRTVREKEITFC